MNELQALYRQTASDAEQQWLTGKLDLATPTKLAAFVAAPRYVARRPVPGKPFWTMDQLARVLLLTSLPTEPEAGYVRTLDTLFDTAELHEGAALYAALPYFAYPERWLLRATDAVRSNMGPVFDAIAFDNPYPARHFPQAAWNQLVLKCIFNDKPLGPIVGLHERANAALAQHLSDLAHERWAAGRTVPADAWQLVPKFMNETLLADVIQLLQSPDPRDQEAARYVCSATEYEPAKALMMSDER